MCGQGPVARIEWAGQEAAIIGGTASAVLSRHAEQTALLVASAAAPQTFVRPSARDRWPTRRW